MEPDAERVPTPVGYFRRKIDRGRARALQERLCERSGAEPPWEAIPKRVPRGKHFIRFSVAKLHRRSNRRGGIFVAAHHVLEHSELDAGLRERLRAELDWFGENLHSPSLDEDRAVFFFRSDALECMKQIWGLLHSLREAGMWAEMQVFESPGSVVYEDEHQVAVVPWTDREVP